MKIGYAMYSARELCRDTESLKSVLYSLADMGYEGVEFFLYCDTSAGELRQIMEECGLQAIGTHVHKPRWDADTDGEIAYAKEAQIPCLVYPWIEPQLRTEEFYRSLPEVLRGLSQECQKNGIRLQYHNHDFEFEKMEDGTALDHLLNADDSWDFELDTFWAAYAGIDVPKLLEKQGDRIKMIHVKDFDGVKKETPSICPIGTGVVDNASIIRTARRLDKEWLIVELDNSPLPVLESAKISIDNIRKMLEEDSE